MSDNLFEAVLDELETFIQPIVEAAESEQARRDLFDAIGVEVVEGEELISHLVTVRESYQTLLAAADDPPETLFEFIEYLDDLDSLIGAIRGIESAAGEVEEGELAEKLLEYLALTYLQTEHPVLNYIAVLLEVIEVPMVDGDSGDVSDQFVRGTGMYSSVGGTGSLRLDRIPEILSDPESVAGEYLPASITSQEDVQRLQGLLTPWLTALFGGLGFTPQVSLPPDPSSTDFGPGSPVKSKLGEGYATLVDDENLLLASQTLSVYKELDGVRFGATFILGASSDHGLSLVVLPVGDLSIAHTGDDWAAELGFTANLDGFVLNADGLGFAEPSATETPAIDQLRASGSVRKLPDETGTAFRVGPTEGTRLEIGEVQLKGNITAGETSIESNILARAGSSAFVLSAGEADGFLSTVLPSEIRAEFDLGLGWATNRSLYLEGGAGLETNLPVHWSLGDALQIDSIDLGIQSRPGSREIPVRVATTIGVSLGPIQAIVEEVGLQANVSFPEGSDGNLGPLNVELAFKPPAGAGISVDASAVVGGGYLSFDPDKERYSGILQLQIGMLSLKAIGLLSTRLPDGRDGFSLLVIITGEFPPVQLGFGFTLNALGGLLGVNRDTKIDVLRSGLRDGTTKSILFPKDPMRNAPRIISDLRSVFPPTSGRHVFGPMARLGWGTPTILTADIGVLLSLPSPVKLVVLGRLHAALPDDDVALVVFNMDAVGAIDFSAKEGSIDATLYDSRIVAYTLTGDMAMRTNWGNDPGFALSVGGFHPRFDPPEGFPSLRRISLTIGPGNPRIRWSGYFAITSNTVQGGAKVELYAKAGKFSVSGDYGFDALFQFNPFKLLVDVSAGFAIKLGGTTLLSARLTGSLEGPNPWHVRGKAKFKIWPLKFSVSVDKKFGERTEPNPLPPADVFGMVVQELGKEGNWSAQLPKGGESIVTLRDMERPSGTVLAHPLGTLQVRQRISPLNVSIEKYGNTQPSTYTKYTIDSVTIGEDSPEDSDQPVREQFAPAQFFERTDDQRLAGPAFERYQAGETVGNTLFAFGGENTPAHQRSVDLEYETTIVDEKEALFPILWLRLAMPHTTAQALSTVSAVARGSLRTSGSERFAGIDDASGPTGIDTSVSVTDTTFVVVDSRDLGYIEIDGVPRDGTTKREAEEALDAVSDSASNGADLRVVATHEATGLEVEP